MKFEANEIYNSISYDGETKRGTETFTRMPLPSQVPAATYNEDLVHLDDEVETIISRLVGVSWNLEVVPIVGMPGLGKTTVAYAVYSSPSVMSHFHIRAWCTVSQIYSTHNLLVQILCSIGSRHPEEYLEVDEDDLAKKSFYSRYLLVLDDLWDVEAWHFLQKSLLGDANGSSILITSRLQNLSLQVKRDSKAYHLCHLTDEKSWQLPQKKLFGKDGCPPSLSGVGFQMAKSCRGVPLIVIHVAGILAATAQNCQEGVARHLSSGIFLDEEHFMKTLDLSYNHLPDDLKSCLLYFGAFQEDEYVPFRRLYGFGSLKDLSKRLKEKLRGCSRRLLEHSGQ